MNRIFSFLALFAIACLLGVMLLGFSLRSVNIRDRNDGLALQRANVHRLAGVGVGVIVLLVESVVVTYFIGTGRWCKEVVETYALDRSYVHRSTRLKRRAFFVATLGMLTVVGIVALGGAADPAALFSRDVPPPAGLTWTNIHLIAALAGACFIGYGFVVEWNHIHANHQVITEVLAEVKRIRTERGLE